MSLSVAAGEFVTVEGPSGSGKTTLLLIAGGLLHPDKGSVLVDKQNVYGMNNDERVQFRAQNIGFVFQQYHLIAYLTVLENILAPGIARPDSGNLKRAERLIEQFGLQQRKRHLPSELSSGEKQRTALARALLCNPKMLLADEITGNLDTENSNIVISCLTAFAQNGGAVLLVTHDHAAAKQADRIELLGE
jgi:ABC-type lipoprotein export system ATPase subunit